MSENDSTVLVVDLDGTLLKSDMLHESFWSAIGRNWRSSFLSLASLFRGKAALKSYLQLEADIDVGLLPYDETVVEYVLAHRAHGGRVALVTASNQAFANDIAQHLQIFDEVYGSDDTINLKGHNKASFLIKRFGALGFCYMGDAASDLPSWRVANKVVTVNATSSVRKQVDRLGKPIEHLITKDSSVGSYVQALRPHQWLKNILIALPMLAGHQFDTTTVFVSVLAFIAFSLVASSVYVLNDLLDLNADRAHPRKRLRPFASGVVPISHGGILALVLLIAGSVMAAVLGWAFMLTLSAYYVLTTAYSLSLKRKVIIDICVLAGLYTIRILAGGIATGIELSVWLLAFSIFLFLSLAAVKRQAELVDMLKRGTLFAKGRGYHVDDLPIIGMISVAAGYVSVLVMALYVSSPSVQELYTLPDALWVNCGVLLYWLTRMVLLTHRGSMHDDPVVFAAKDLVSQVCFGVILLFAVAGALL